MSVIAPVRTVFRAAATVMVPGAAMLEEDGWRDLERIVDHAIAQRPRKMQRQFRLFLRMLDFSTLARHRMRFHRLDLAERTAVLERMERAPRLLLRRGVWGLRTLVFMGYYGQPVHGAAIGYRATAHGWTAREAPPEVPARQAAAQPSREHRRKRGQRR